MLGRKNRISLQFKFVAIASLAVAACLLGLMAVYAKTNVWLGAAKVTSKSAGLDGQLPQPVPVATSFFTPAGLPVQITAAAAINDKGATGLSYTIINTGSAEISGVDLALFEFNQAGALMKVHAWNLQPSLSAGKSASFSFPLKFAAAAASRLVLAVEAVRGNADFSKNTATHWQVNFTDLAQTIGVLAAGGKDTGLQPSQRTGAIPELYGSSYCSDAFAKAFQFSKTGDARPLNAFSCDRTQRSLVFGFNGKSLIQK